MKLTKSYLKQLIKEELLFEAESPPLRDTGEWQVPPEVTQRQRKREGPGDLGAEVPSPRMPRKTKALRDTGCWMKGDLSPQCLQAQINELREEIQELTRDQLDPLGP